MSEPNNAGATRTHRSAMASSRRLIVLPAVLLLWACPYEAPFQPAAPVAPLRSVLVGVWSCTSDTSSDRFLARAGWKGTAQYGIILRPEGVAAVKADDDPLNLAAVPRFLSGTEIWSLWEENDSQAPKLGFGKLVEADQHHFVVEWLGNGINSTAPVPATPAALAKLLESPETKAEGTFRCVRQQKK